ncbi:M56 family metallopeptidase [Chamaesiphon sp. VAR_48_metabat_403]|uniref:M56 family metallopeptidase n=1 Tax=Chamaesiphon sp. VAR_48_metabat_403 TaxID=2964700 RepID=UPI00286DB6E2|nr:M56 family metallopeptidase [Chamaesiphon sp. VAR_48_metabat_403]
MHLIVLLTIFAVAWGLRYTWAGTDRVSWIDRWQRTLAIFLLPPLLLFTSAIAIIWMGPHGRMVWVGNDWLSYCVGIGFLGFAALSWLKLAGSGWQMLSQIRTYPTTELNGKSVRILDLPTPYSAQIGFWEPELVVTQGLLDTLSTAHLEAVLAHEQAHYRYRDTWCFFWLGWLHQMTTWLPQTEAIWQELLMLRELRADRWASIQTDPLLVAEALLSIVQNTPIFPDNICAAFSQTAPADRLTQRIEALLDRIEINGNNQIEPSQNLAAWAWLLVAVLPLLAVPFHS